MPSTTKKTILDNIHAHCFKDDRIGENVFVIPSHIYWKLDLLFRISRGDAPSTKNGVGFYRHEFEQLNKIELEDILVHMEEFTLKHI
jgi:hypothetical protein